MAAAVLGSYERSLLADITKDRYLRDLADTPLLAGLLCALNRHLRSNLPRRRTEIYERALAMFDQRDQARNILPGEVRLDLAAKTYLLADLALWMIRNAASEVGSDAAIRQIGRSLAGLPGSDYQPEIVFRFLMERTGLLREPAAGRADFIHRTFQEYLAARAAVDGDAIGELIANAGNDQWGEVVVLAVGQANQAQTAQLLHGLVRRNWRGQQRYGRQVLAVASLQEVRSLEPSLRQEVESVIPHLLPPQSMEQAEQLSAVGERLIPLLASHWTRDTRRAPETIRAASLVGGDAAMGLIRDVSLRHDIPDVASEVSRAWQYFDADDYARRVLAASRPREIDVSSGRFLRALTAVPSVARLTIHSGERAGMDLDPATVLPGVKELTLQGTHPDLPALDSFPQLESLTIWNYPYGDIRQLPFLPTLTKLEIYSSIALTSLDGIERQPAITRVGLYGCENLSSVSHLSQLPSLKRIFIARSTRLDLHGFTPSGSRLVLTLQDCGDVNLGPLGGTRGLRVHYDNSTRLHNTEELGEGSAVQEMTKAIADGIWPFNNERA